MSKLTVEAKEENLKDDFLKKINSFKNTISNKSFNEDNGIEQAVRILVFNIIEISKGLTDIQKYDSSIAKGILFRCLMESAFKLMYLLQGSVDQRQSQLYKLGFGNLSELKKLASYSVPSINNASQALKQIESQIVLIPEEFRFNTEGKELKPINFFEILNFVIQNNIKFNGLKIDWYEKYRFHSGLIHCEILTIEYYLKKIISDELLWVLSNHLIDGCQDALSND
jgi:hypothetical protein